MGNLPHHAGQSPLRTDRQDPYLRIHAVNIFVRDQDRSLQFYRDQLGFDLAFDARLPSGGRWVAVSPPDGTAVLTLVAPKPNSKEYGFIGRATQVVFVTEDVTAKFHEWRLRGVRFSHTPRLRRVRYARAAGPASPASGEAPVWGGVFTRFQDPDGNSFALVGFDEVSRKWKRNAARRRRKWKRNAAPPMNWKSPNRCRAASFLKRCRP